MASKGYQASSLVESLVSGDRQELGGILFNDANGLCVSSYGEGLEQGNSGVYTNLVRLASQLQHGQEENAEVTPTITIETEDSAVVCKEYHSQTVAVRVPFAATSVLSTETTEDASSE
jgi:hypothetical protein